MKVDVGYAKVTKGWYDSLHSISDSFFIQEPLPRVVRDQIPQAINGSFMTSLHILPANTETTHHLGLFRPLPPRPWLFPDRLGSLRLTATIAATRRAAGSPEHPWRRWACDGNGRGGKRREKEGRRERSYFFDLYLQSPVLPEMG